MKIIKIIPFLLILTLYNSSSFAETKKDCSSIKSDTAAKLYKKWKCKQGIPEGEGFGKKFKNFFKKKN